MTRIPDMVLSLLGLILLFPFFVLIALAIIIDSRGSVFFVQRRVGRGGKIFSLFKFRTMKTGSESQGLITIGISDSRITRIGSFLRKYKLDELPQLWNVLVGQMSLVGPRPEVPKYVELYNEEQKNVLKVRPGITDFASIRFADEDRMMDKGSDPEKHYVNVIMPGKLKLSLIYVNNPGLRSYFYIILKTLIKVFMRK
jgi:lipopolysaccharide/colanic/teichoic acid biosynthesis glycosyltransferase